MDADIRITRELLASMNKAADLGGKGQDILATIVDSLVSILHEAAKFEAGERKYKQMYEATNSELIAKTGALRNHEVEIIALGHERDDYREKLNGIISELRQDKAASETASMRRDSLIAKYGAASVVSLVRMEDDMRQIEAPR